MEKMAPIIHLLKLSILLVGSKLLFKGQTVCRQILFCTVGVSYYFTKLIKIEINQLISVMKID